MHYFCRYMKQLRANRDEERELMKDVEGWEVGKWKGEPVYWNEVGRFPEVSADEYYAHAPIEAGLRRLHEKIFH